MIAEVPETEEEVAWRNALLPASAGHDLRRHIVALETASHDVATKLDAIHKKLDRIKSDDERITLELRQQEDSTKRLKQRLEEQLHAAEREKEAEKEREEKEKRPKHLSRINVDGARGKRMFQGVLGVLNKQKKELESDGHKQRVILQKQVEERLNQESRLKQAENLANMRLALTENSKACTALAAALPPRILALRSELAKFNREQHHMHLAAFLVTTAEPPVYWVPTIHTAATREMTRARKAAALPRYTEFSAHFHTVQESVRTSTLVEDANRVQGTAMPAQSAPAAVYQTTVDSTTTTGEGETKLDEEPAQPPTKKQRVE